LLTIPVTIKADVFNRAYRPLLNDHNRFNVLIGGAGSGKSVFVTQRNIIRWMEGGHNFLILRKVGRTSRHSTFALTKQILSSWSIPAEWYKVNESEMTITNTINGSKMLFMGLDDREKIKSITFAKGVLTDVWMEEASEFSKSDFKQLNLRLRGRASVPFQLTLSFNPISALSWIKKEFFDFEKPRTTILHTTYRDNRWVDNEYKAELESLKHTDPVLYDIYALGKWGVLGNLILTNYVIHDFDVDDPKFKQDVFGGMDFGWNHKSAALKIAEYDGEWYILNEVWQSYLTNGELIDKVKQELGTGFSINADSAEPDRIMEFQRAGMKVTAAKKGKGSIKSQIDILKTKRIHIHATNCPGTAKEIQQWKWREDKDGNVLDEPVPFQDDAMAALRYAAENRRFERIKIKYDSVVKRDRF
jgi:phage terminase large subunit